MAGSVLVDRVQTNLTGYSVQEDATPLDPSNTTGGVGQIDFSAEYIDGPEGSIMLQGLPVELRDAHRGTTFGVITDAGLGDNQQVDLTAVGRLGALVGTVSARPMVDTLQNVLMYYFSLGGITDGIVIDPEIGFIPVAVPGFSDDLWLRTKQLVSVNQCEIALVSNKVVVRPIRSYESNFDKLTDIAWKIARDDAAQNIEVTYYNNAWVGNDIVYPYTDDERSNAQSWQVDDGQVLEDDFTTTVSLASVEQPVCMDSVPQDYGNDDATTDLRIGSVYSVYDANNAQITAANWRSNGGKIELSINDDTTSLHIKITAAKGVGTAPYRIVGRTPPTGAHSEEESETKTDYGKKNTSKDNKTVTTVTGINITFDDEGEDYPSLFVVGNGVAVTPKKITVPTGVVGTTSVNEIGTTVEVSAVTDLEDAYRIAVIVAGNWTGANLTLSGTLTEVNQINGSGEVKTRSIGEFNVDYNGNSIAQFNAKNGLKSIGQFNAEELAKVSDTFENQTFGNVAGSRLRYGDAFYRVTTATITDADITFQASEDTTIGDFNEAFAGKTIADFNAQFAGKTFRQYNRIPLNQKTSSGTIYVPPVSTEPYPDTFYPDELYPGADPNNVARVDSAVVDTSKVG